MIRWRRWFLALVIALLGLWILVPISRIDTGTASFWTVVIIGGWLGIIISWYQFLLKLWSGPYGQYRLSKGLTDNAAARVDRQRQERVEETEGEP